MNRPIAVHLTDDHAVFRCGLRAFIEKEPDLRVVGETADAASTLDAVTRAKPDVLILDINMPGMPAAQLVSELVARDPAIAILILTIHDEERYLREFLQLGVKGFMVKTSTGDELIHAIKQVARGEQYVDPALSSLLIARYIGRPAEKREGAGVLTDREREICAYLALGHTNAEIATALGISKRTVETHRASIVTKTGLHSRAEIVQFAMDQGLMSLANRPGDRRA